jgi:aldose 1-epimerase
LSEIALFTLRNETGTLVARVTNYGGKMMQLLVPDRKGQLGDVLLGWDSLEDTMKHLPSAGAIIGRYANRISGGKFTLGGREYVLTKNDGARPNTVHGGAKGSRFVVFDAVQLDAGALELTYPFKDGEEGFPGNCRLTVVYALTADELRITYRAVTDRPTVVNFTQHNFWNLAGEGNGTVLDHEVWIDADRFTPVNQDVVPTGEVREVKGTPFDFTTPKPIGRHIGQDDEQLRYTDGYDQNFVLNKRGDELGLAGRVFEPTSGRVMEVFTTEPGMQLFSGNNLAKDGSLKGKGGKTYAYRGAFCLETQHFPDSPNHPEFPSTVLEPGRTLTSTTVYRFGVRR